MLKGRSPAKHEKRSSPLVSAIWALNAVLVCGAVAAYPLLRPQIAALLEPLPTAVPPLASPSNAPLLIQMSPPSPTLPTAQTFIPASNSTPTSAPPPAATRFVTSTASPLPYSQGPFTIGFSAGKRPLQMWRFGTGQVQRLIVAGIHGGAEINTIALTDELIAHLLVHPEIVPADMTLYILRSLNPDGEARGAVPAGRANDNGVDLNRNWPYNWQADWERDGCWNIFPLTAGDHGASEPETFALMQFIIQHRIDVLISYHSAALGIFPGGRPEYEPSVRLAEAIAEVTNYPYPALDTGCEYTGNLTDWAASRGIAAVDIELTNKTDTDFNQNSMALFIFLNWKR